MFEGLDTSYPTCSCSVIKIYKYIFATLAIACWRMSYNRNLNRLGNRNKYICFCFTRLIRFGLWLRQSPTYWGSAMSTQVWPLLSPCVCFTWNICKPQGVTIVQTFEEFNWILPLTGQDDGEKKIEL